MRGSMNRAKSCCGGCPDNAKINTDVFSNTETTEEPTPEEIDNTLQMLYPNKNFKAESVEPVGDTIDWLL